MRLTLTARSERSPAVRSESLAALACTVLLFCGLACLLSGNDAARRLAFPAKAPCNTVTPSVTPAFPAKAPAAAARPPCPCPDCRCPPGEPCPCPRAGESVTP